MGNSRFSSSDWAAYSSTTSTKARHEIFTRRDMVAELDPKKIKLRESVDSEKNPQSTPIILACDVTGSMGMLAETIVKHGLGTIMQEIYDRKPVTDPHIMCMATGDAYMDHAPLQVTQFEADVSAITSQIESVWLEGGGGGNMGESYGLAWYFAAYKTVCDSLRKRKKKGYLFTIGDENILATITKKQVETVFGDGVETDFQMPDLLTITQSGWEVFHLVVKPVHALDYWKSLLGERVIEVSNHERLAEVIVSTIQVIEGHDADKVAKSWSGDTSLVVANAIGGLAKRAADTAVVRL